MRQPVTSPSASAVGPYSHGVEANGVVYCSGQTPVEPATGALAEGDQQAFALRDVARQLVEACRINSDAA